VKPQRPHFWFRLHAGSPLRAVGLVLVLVAAIGPLPAFGSGNEHTTNADDLTIRSDTRWAGGGEGGYLPIRVRVTNHGKPRDLTFEFESYGEGNSVRVRRAIGVDQNATVHFTLSVPLVEPRDGTLHVYDGSSPLHGHQRSISVPSGLYLSPSPPAMLVVSPVTVDCARFVDMANHKSGASATPRYGYGYGRGTIDASQLANVVPSDLLPESWIDYSGLDYLAIPRDELERLEHPVRTAILKWVQSGGSLLVYDVGKDADVLSRLDRLIEAPESTTTTTWQHPEPTNRPSGEITVTEEGSPSVVYSTGPGMPTVTSSAPKSTKPATTKTKTPEPPWPGGKDAFRTRSLMLGTVCAFPGNPFPGTINDWLWFDKSCGEPSWTVRHGFSPHIGTKDFFKFMNPGIHGVPTIAFLVLITLFSILIGPVNYLYLSRKKMLWLLLFTVPALACGTSVLLLGYSVAAHGFATKSRIRSLTVLDQRNHTAVTMARLALFAGVSPSGGMRFSPETAVYPVIPTTNDPASGYVDWSETQNLTSGWLPARTRTQFFTVRNAEQRSRVELKKTAGKAEFSNGLPWELEMVVVSDESGHFYVGRSVAAGATVALAEPTTDDLADFVALLNRNAPALPTGFVEPTPSAFRGGRAWMAYMMHGSVTTDFSGNLMESRIGRWRIELPRKKGLAPRSYVAVLRQNPGVETGVPATTDEMSLHLLNGYF
jgi:hypothetical protein